MPLYLGLDPTAQGLFAALIRVDTLSRSIVSERPIIHHDLRFALDRLFFDLAMSAELPIEDLRVIAFSAIDESAVSALMPMIADRVEYGGSARLAVSWRDRYSLPPATILASPPQIPAEAIGLGVVSDRMLGVMLSTEDTIVGSNGRRLFRNGASARDAVMAQYGVDTDVLARVLASDAGNDGAVMLPWFGPEVTPPVVHPGIRRFGFDSHSAPHNIRGVIEAQMMAMANHTADVSPTPVDRIVASGPGAISHAVLQVMANVFGADVQRLDVDHPAALGAALHAFHADRLSAGEPLTWRSVVAGFVHANPGHRASPNPRLVAMYEQLRQNYAVLERIHRDRPPIC